MEKTVTCLTCLGEGAIEITGTKQKCLSCGGKGYTIRSGTQRRCAPCKGTGKRGSFKQCPDCNGLGVVPG